jgi:glycosyltransferase involved in cell wall biosynthesis
LLASDLMASPGGATAVTAWLAEALMDEHDVTLNATGREISFSELNRLYGTHLDAAKLKLRQWPQWSRLTGRLRLLQLAALVRRLRGRPGDYDLYVSATNEVMLPAPHLQYIHFPQRHFPAMRRQFSGLSFYLRAANELLCRFIACSPRIDLTKSRLLTNSAWSSSQIFASYGVAAEVVYPPVRISAGAPVTWSKRDLAAIAVGRFHPQKRLHDAIFIVDKLHQHFPGLKLHVVGFGRGEYRDYIRRLALSRTFVSVHENMSRHSLTQLMSKCRFGIHCAPNEHFGMSPAELAACGCLVFVHNSGGQVEIVDKDDELLFNNAEEACQKMAHKIENSEIAETKALRHSESARTRFSSDHFIKQVRNAVRRLTEAPYSSPSLICDDHPTSPGKHMRPQEYRA